MFFRGTSPPSLEPNDLNYGNIFTIYHLNIRSARYKIDELRASWNQPPDILCLTEHWLHEDESLIIPDFTCISKFCRGSGLGGGVSIYYNNKSSVEFIATSGRSDLVRQFCNEHCFEFSIVNIKLVHSLDHQRSNLKFVLICLYRAPHNNVQEFIERLEKLIYSVKKEKEFILICGDWNVNFLDSVDLSVIKIRNILMSFNLRELVSRATRVTANCKSLLDNVVTNLDSKIVSCNSFFNTMSDHDSQLIAINYQCKATSCTVKKECSQNKISLI